MSIKRCHFGEKLVKILALLKMSGYRLEQNDIRMIPRWEEQQSPAKCNLIKRRAKGRGGGRMAMLTA